MESERGYTEKTSKEILANIYQKTAGMYALSALLAFKSERYDLVGICLFCGSLATILEKIKRK